MKKSEILKILENYSDNDEVSLMNRKSKIDDELVNLLPFVIENKDNLIEFMKYNANLKNVESFADIFMLRVQNKCSLETISKKYGVSRERIRQQVNKFVDIINEFKNYKEPIPFIVYNDERLYNVKIEQLDLNVRCYNALKRSGINTVNDIVLLGIKGIRKVKNLGLNSTNEIIKIMNALSPSILSLEHDDYFIDDSIWSLKLSYGHISPLFRAGIKTISDFMNSDIESIKKLNGIGNKRIEGIIKELDRVKCEVAI